MGKGGWHHPKLILEPKIRKFTEWKFLFFSSFQQQPPPLNSTFLGGSLDSRESFSSEWVGGRSQVAAVGEGDINCPPVNVLK